MELILAFLLAIASCHVLANPGKIIFEKIIRISICVCVLKHRIFQSIFYRNLSLFFCLSH